jgi:hypothetical protein
LSEPDDVSSDVVDDANSGGGILTPPATEAPAAAPPTPALLLVSNHDDVGRSAAVEIDGGVTPSNDETAGTTGVCDESDAAADVDDDDDESDGIMGANDAVDGGRKKGDGTALAVAKLAKCSGALVADIESECDSGVGDGARVGCSSGVGAPGQTRFALLGNAVASMARRLASLITEARESMRGDESNAQRAKDQSNFECCGCCALPAFECPHVIVQWVKRLALKRKQHQWQRHPL